MTVAPTTDSVSDIPAGVHDPADNPSLHLPYRAPFAWDSLLSFLGARALPGVEEVRGHTYRRSVRTADGHAAVIALSPDQAGENVTLESLGRSRIGPTLFMHDARRAFDLDADPLAIDASLARDPKLAPLVAKSPGMRVPGTFDGFELVVRGIFGQQVSVAGARTSLGRLVERFGTPLDPPSAEITHLFPTAEQVAELPPGVFGMPRARAETIRRVADLVARGELDLSGDTEPQEALHTLGELPGIGPWTLAYVAMRALRDPDAFMVGDLGVRRGFEALGLPSAPKELLSRAERWRPWRAYAVMHLWHTHP